MDLMDMNKLEKILKGKKIMYNSNVKEVIISDDVENIAVEAFAYLPELMKIHFGARIHEIPSKCCVGCNLLEEIKFSKDTESIGTAAFCRISENHSANFEIITSDTEKAKYYKYRDDEDISKYINCKEYDNLVELPHSIKKLGKLAFGGNLLDTQSSWCKLFFNEPSYILSVSNKQWNEFKEAFKGIGRLILITSKDGDEETITEFQNNDTRDKIRELALAKHSPDYDNWTRRLNNIYIANSDNSGTGEARKKDIDIKQIGDVEPIIDNAGMDR